MYVDKYLLSQIRIFIMTRVFTTDLALFTILESY